MKLLIVESPAKAKKIAGFLDDSWTVEACRGHVRDLPVYDLGVNVDAGFQPQYEILVGKTNLVKRLLKAIRQADAVYLATDPDREGEAIAWHLLQLAGNLKDKPVYRAVFNAITANAVKQALEEPRELDQALVDAQNARRIIDRLVGYLVSPVAVKALDKKTLSAGRVQSVALRLVVDREREIDAFEPETYWTIRALVDADGTQFEAKLHRLKGADARFSTRQHAASIVKRLQDAQLWVSKVGQTHKHRQPLPPFTTSSLQQAAAKGLGLSPDRVMGLAQTLYESGLITYHRTDGVAVAPEAQTVARDVIGREYGQDYLPATPPTYTAKTDHAQEAHEAIRPTDINHLPDETATGDGAKLYALIWRRFIASQMNPALYTLTGILIHAGQTTDKPFPLAFQALGRTLIFDGFLRVYEEPSDDESTTATETTLPLLKEGQPLGQANLTIDEGQTRPPSRFSEAGLIGALERYGVGRPSTYASMVSLIKDKGYVTLTKRQLIPTETGTTLGTFLTERFPQVFDVGYTARLEKALDRVATGDMQGQTVLSTFWRGFQPQLKTATEHALAQVKARHTPKPLVLYPTED